jgi:hypothetical protein
MTTPNLDQLACDGVTVADAASALLTEQKAHYLEISQTICEVAKRLVVQSELGDKDSRDFAVNLDLLKVAEICYEANRVYCQSIGDDSQSLWVDAPQWQKDSAILGVKLHAENPQSSAAASHESWMAQKVFDGWVYGDIKDPENKKHPCIMNFENLPKIQQYKDYLFRAIVHGLIHEPFIRKE